jgi:hypothetical protein
MRCAHGPLAVQLLDDVELLENGALLDADQL